VEGPAPVSATAWTPARRRGLVVLAHGHQHNQPVFESNQTSRTDAPRLTVYWQTLTWLIQQGYAKKDRPARTLAYGEQITLTDAGIQLARQEALIR
jgi:hypothetical protein